MGTWKDFFYYSKAERRVVLLLAALLLILSGIVLWMRHERLSRSPELTVSEVEGIDSFVAQLRDVEKRWEKPIYPKRDSVPVVLQDFDPNKADSMMFRTLGLPAFIAHNIIRYRLKGGVFRSAESFSKIYGLTTEQYELLKPYIVISEEFRQKPRLFPDTLERKSFVSLKYPAGTILDLNEADTSSLKKIPGIGSGIARMIIAYRERLGGFYAVHQIKEIEYVSDTLSKWFQVSSPVYRKIEVNKAGLDRLRNHPYMNFYKAKVILEYRRKRGRIEGMAQLSMFEEFSEDDLKKLEPYLSFD